MTTGYTWIPLYRELADRLVEWESRQTELVALLEQIREEGYVVSPLNDKDEQGNRFLLKEIDPFTFFGTFNRAIRDENRRGILAILKKHLGAESPLPDDFDGIPTLNNQRSWFISYRPSRQPNDVSRLWQVFRLALGDKPLESPEFLSAFDEALKVRCTNMNLTMGLYWIRPEIFLNLDQTNRTYLGIKLPSSGLNSAFYRSTIVSVQRRGKPLFEISRDAWLKATEKLPTAVQLPPENNYWLVGAYWNDMDPSDQTDRFLSEGIWQNGYHDKYLDDVKSMNVGDRIAIKSSATQKHNLPFDARGNTVSRMTIKAVGTIVANRSDGRTVEVDWDRSFQSKDWFFHTGQSTIWQIRRDNESSKKLIEFVFEGKPQDYEWFCNQQWGAKSHSNLGGEPKSKEPQPYSLDDIVAAGVFLTKPELQQSLDRLRSKKNLILQGTPGVGKTFLARRLAYALMEATDEGRIEFVQFHQSYSYEDFVRGYRPLPTMDGKFGLQDGVFFEFCRRAAQDLDRPYVFIIDEINRGNLSQIFGELLMLIESDKRGPDHAVPLVYRKEDEPRFFVPENLHLIGLMNLADRSLALVDYALRRRFAFMTLRAQYSSPIFKSWLLDRQMNSELVELIVARMTELNQQITDDPMLGENFQVGHSFFCPRGEDFAGLDRHWYEGIVATEIGPLLREYWFDNSKRADEAQNRLLAK